MLSVLLLASTFSIPQARAAERELDEDAAPGSVEEIKTPIERVIPKVEKKRPLFPRMRERIQDLPSFLADTTVEARYRTYYLRQDRSNDTLSEAWAMGGSIYYRSGWLEDVFALEAEGFTSQPVVAERSKRGTGLLEPVQNGYSVLGIANAKLRYAGLELTGFRQYLDLPYVNRRDNRMTPNTFESLVLARTGGRLRFSGGYSWRVKLRASDDFESFTKAIGLGRNRGLWHAGAIVTPVDGFDIGAVAAGVPDLFMGYYGEVDLARDLGGGLGVRLDSQFTYQADDGDDLLGDGLDNSWNVGLRASTSYGNALGRLGVSVTSSQAAIVSLFGTSPSYVSLMQRTFTAKDEKALLASVSYDFSGLGATGLSAIVNYVAAFDGERGGESRDAQTLDLTLDYRPKAGWLRDLWLRLRGSWLDEDSAEQDGFDVRVILRYDFPVI
ncbi:MAG: OprD family outer membrane porin [Deltaproteobacteria bacterium]|nr:OprD family outer membrane porin [Deltaproteobacteria bacterium]